MTTASSVFERDVPLFVESGTGWIAKYPARRWARWGLRLIAALPFVGIAVWFHVASGGDWSGTANGSLAEQVSAITWWTSDVNLLADLYPPVTSVLALLIPGGALGLAIAGSLVAGTLVQLVVQSLQRKGFPLPLRLAFIITLAVTPMFAYVATTSFEAVLGLAFYGLGMVDLVRFVTYANTQAGFRAGILFAGAAFSDTTGLFLALVAAVAAALIVRSRSASRVANAIVIVFPSVALLAALVLLGLAFRAGPLAMIRGELSWSAERASVVAETLLSPSGLLYLAPTAVVVLTAIALRFPFVGLVGVLLTSTILLAFILGLTPPGTAGVNYLQMLLLAVAIVPLATTRVQALLTGATTLVLLVVGWLQAFDNGAVSGWMGVLTGGAA